MQAIWLRAVSSLSSLSSVSFINSLPADKHALHDIRYRFKVNDIWSIIVSNYPELKLNDRSKDISLSPIETNDLMIRVVIHHTDTVSVSVGCSMKPVVSDIGGLIRLSNALTRVEERLSRLVDGSNQLLLSTNFTLFRSIILGLLPCGISVLILLMVMLARDTRSRGKMEKML